MNYEDRIMQRIKPLNSSSFDEVARRSVGKRQFGDMSAPVYSTTPSGLNAVVNSFTPYDLIQNPDYTPTAGSLAGFTPDRSNPNGVQGAFIVPEEIKKNRYSPSGVAIHEVAHYNDPRLDNTNKNLGFTTFNGGYGYQAGQELPAILAERLLRLERRNK